MCVNRHTFISATRDFLNTSWTHETHYWGLKSLNMLQWTSTSAKLRVLWVQTSKHFYSLFQKIDSILNIISTFLFVINRLKLRSLDHTQKYTHTNTHTHTHTHTQIPTWKDWPVPESDNYTKHIMHYRRASMYWTRLEPAVATIQRPRTARPPGPTIVYLLHTKLIFPENTPIICSHMEF